MKSETNFFLPKNAKHSDEFTIVKSLCNIKFKLNVQWLRKTLIDMLDR